MTFTEALKMAEDLLEQVCAAGEDNWNRLSDSKKLVRSVRLDIERQEREATQKRNAEKTANLKEKEEKVHGGSDDAEPERNPKNDTGAV